MIDPFMRSRKIDNIWSYSGRDSSEVAHAKPLAYLNMNVRDQGAASTLSFDQIKTLFNEFGSVIQILLTQTEYSEFSDLNTVELDGLDLANKLFQKLIFEPEVMKLVSAHTNTGEPVPAETLLQLRNGLFKN
jgi:oligopeptidase A